MKEKRNIDIDKCEGCVFYPECLGDGYEHQDCYQLWSDKECGALYCSQHNEGRESIDDCLESKRKTG